MGRVRHLILSLFLLSSFGWTNSQQSKNPITHKDYSGWKLIDTKLIPNDGENPLLSLLEDHNDIRILGEDRTQDTVQLLVPRESFDDVTWRLTTEGHRIRTSENDFSRLLTPTFANVRVNQLPTGAVTFDRYMTFQEIENYIKNLQEKYPDKIRRRVLGVTTEGRNIHALIITNRRAVLKNEQPEATYTGFEDAGTQTDKDESETDFQTDSEFHYSDSEDSPFRYEENSGIFPTLSRKRKTERPVIFIDGGIHAREWISPAAVLNVAENLVNNPQLTREFEWWLVPVVNPDGYVYSWEHDRMWRKNRGRSGSASCVGVDLNRNFDHHWMESGASQNPCVEVYAGPSAFSEPESRALKDAILRVQDRLEAYVSVHSYGQLILYSYGYSSSVVHKNRDMMNSVADGMVKAIRRVHGTEYSSGPGASQLYTASGASDDWATDIGGAPISYTFELRDKGAHGFLLPEGQIKPAVDELWTGLQNMAKSILKGNTESEIRDSNIVPPIGFRPIPDRGYQDIPSQISNYGINYVSKISLKPLQNRNKNPIIKIVYDKNNNPLKAFLFPQQQSNLQPNAFTLQQTEDPVRDSSQPMQTQLFAASDPGHDTQQPNPLVNQQPFLGQQPNTFVNQQPFLGQQPNTFVNQQPFIGQQPDYSIYQPGFPVQQSPFVNQQRVSGQQPAFLGQNPAYAGYQNPVNQYPISLNPQSYFPHQYQPNTFTQSPVSTDQQSFLSSQYPILQLQHQFPSQQQIFHGHQPVISNQELTLSNQNPNSADTQFTDQDGYFSLHKSDLPLKLLILLQQSRFPNQQQVTWNQQLGNLNFPQNIGVLRQQSLQQGNYQLIPNRILQSSNKQQSQYYTLYQPSLSPILVSVGKPSASQSSQILPFQNYQSSPFQNYAQAYQASPLHNYFLASQSLPLQNSQGLQTFKLVPIRNVNTEISSADDSKILSQDLQSATIQNNQASLALISEESSVENPENASFQNKPLSLLTILAHQHNNPIEVAKNEYQSASIDKVKPAERE